jgi:outer membrane biosynthesis protein TonB
MKIVRPSSSWRAAAGALALAGLASACARPQARVAVEPPPPPLAVPAPPPRIILPPDPTPPPAVEEAPAPAVPQRVPRPRPSAPRPDRTEPPRPAENAVVEPPKPANGQDPAPAASPGPTIGMQPGSGAAEGAVRQLLSRAQDDLGRVDYAALSSALKAQYDTAKRFIVLGEQALKEQNLIYAGTLADKASAIAALLLRR